MELEVKPVMVITRAHTKRMQEATMTVAVAVSEENDTSEIVTAVLSASKPELNDNETATSQSHRELISPASEKFQLLVKIDKHTLRKEQADDASLQSCQKKNRM